MHLDPSAFLADPDLLQALEKRATPIFCVEARMLFNQGDAAVGLYMVSKGEVTLSMDPGNAAVFSCQATAGSLLGLPGVIGNQPYSLTAVACPGSQVYYLPKDEFAALMQSELPLMVKVLQVLAAEVRSARMAITQF